MPTVQMPGGTMVEMPDMLTPEMGRRLRAYYNAQQNVIPRTVPEGFLQSAARTVAPYARPALEMGGALGGGLVATPSGPMGAAVGAGLGYAGGARLADLLERYGKGAPPPPLGEEAVRTLKDIGIGSLPGGVGGGVVKRALTAGLAGAGAGILSSESKGDIPLHALLGGGIGALSSLGLSGGGKVFNYLTKETPLTEMEQLSKRFRIRTTLGEVTRNPLTQKTESRLESVPWIGLKGFREKQQAEAQQASKRFLAQYIIDPDSPDVMATNRAYTSSLYQNLKQNVIGLEDRPIYPTETRAAAKDLLERYPHIFKRFQDTKREGIIREILSDTRPMVKNFELPPALQQYEKEETLKDFLQSLPKTRRVVKAKTISFDQAWQLRQGLGEMVGQARRKLANGEIDRTTLGEVSKLYAGIDKDMTRWANDFIDKPQIMASLKEANAAYKQYVVKYDIIQRAMDKAEGTVGAGEMFSPKKFSTALKDIIYKNRETKTFTPIEVEEMSGLANILQVVKRAGQYAENPPTGNRWGIPVVAMEAGLALAEGTPGGLGTAGGLITYTGIARFLTGTETGKKLALVASKIEPESPMMKNIVRMIYNQVGKIAVTEATQ